MLVTSSTFTSLLSDGTSGENTPGISGEDTPLKITYRILNAVLPIFTLLATENRISNLVNQSLMVATTTYRTFTDIGSYIKDYKQNGLTKKNWPKAAGCMLEAATLVACVVSYRFGLIFSSGSSLCTSAYITIVKLKNKEYKSAGFELAKTIAHGFRFAGFIHPLGLELHIIAIALQIIVEIGQAYKAYKKESYMKTISSIRLALMNTYLLVPHLKVLSKDSSFKVTMCHQKIENIKNETLAIT